MALSLLALFDLYGLGNLSSLSLSYCYGKLMNGQGEGLCQVVAVSVSITTLRY